MDLEVAEPIRIVLEHSHLLKSYLLVKLLQNKPASRSSWLPPQLDSLEQHLLVRLARLFSGHGDNESDDDSTRRIYACLLDRYQREVDPSFCLSGGGAGAGVREEASQSANDWRLIDKPRVNHKKDESDSKLSRLVETGVVNIKWVLKSLVRGGRSSSSSSRSCEREKEVGGEKLKPEIRERLERLVMEIIERVTGMAREQVESMSSERRVRMNVYSSRLIVQDLVQLIELLRPCYSRSTG